jgi:acetyl-CoA acetyltransferase
MHPVYIAGLAMTKFGKEARPLVDILKQAAQGALADAGFDGVDAVYLGVMNCEEFTGESNLASQLVDALGLTGAPALRVETASSSGAAVLLAGFQAVASQFYRRVLVVAGEKMTHLSTSSTTRVLAEVIDPDERLCGATMPALAAMITEKYRERYHLSSSRLENMLCAVALKNHRNGSHNALAQFQKPISREAYLGSKLVATPLRLYDCAPITDGAAALVLTADKTDVRLAGIGHGTGPVSLRHRETFTSFPATRIAAARAYRMAGVSPADIDFAEVHDAFTPFEIISTEDLGFFPAGKGGEAVLEGKTALDGILPINPTGGLKARGHPVGASGLAQVVEAAKVLKGESTIKKNVKRGLTQSTGGLATNNFVTILERADAPAAKEPAAPLPLANAPGRQVVTGKTPLSDDGVIETFTTLYVTPDGFLPPLALALVRDRQGHLVMAQGEDNIPLKIGQEVFLRRFDGVCVFAVKSQIQRVQEAFMKLFGRKNTKEAQNQRDGDPA